MAFPFFLCDSWLKGLEMAELSVSVLTEGAEDDGVVGIAPYLIGGPDGPPFP